MEFQGQSNSQLESPEGPQEPPSAGTICFPVEVLADQPSPNEEAAREIAEGLDSNDGRALQRLRADAATMDKKQFDEFLKLVDKYEQRGKGVDVVIGQDGKQYLTFPSAYAGEGGRGRTILGTKEAIPDRESDRKKVYGNQAEADGPVRRVDRPERQ